MVSLILSGGLGNQMFQYAAAKALAKRLNTSLVMDMYALERRTKATKRDYELDIFNIDGTVKSSLKSKLFYKARPLILKHRASFLKLGCLADEWSIVYDPNFEKIKGNVSMLGYFQNERYFKSIEDELRTDFSFKQALDEKNSIVANEIASTQSVAIHIRRGDYMSDKDAASNFVTCSKEYYQKAISEIAKTVANPVFYIFSEDFEWVDQNITFDSNEGYFINWNKGEDSYRDMQLMSLCKHNIIANSSFSWWGAWLNSNANKIVIAPSLWFKDGDKNSYLDRFYPEGWIKI